MADRESDIRGLTGRKYTVAPGATNALLIEPTTLEGAGILKYFSGGSLEIYHAPQGSPLLNGATTQAGASLVALSAGGTMGYLMGTSEIVNIDGGCRFYLMATGATVIAYQLKGLTVNTIF